MLETASARGGRALAIQTLDAGIVVDNPEAHRFTAQVAWQRIDALVAAQDTVDDSYLQEFAQTGKPVVMMYREPRGIACPSIVPDNHGGMHAAIEHLIGHGHTSIAFVGRDPANADDGIRYRAYREAMLHGGLEPHQPWTVTWQQDEVYQSAIAMRQFLDHTPPPTAAVACTDLTAMSLITALTEAGVTVPDDMAVIGFDDITDAATFQPPLSTVAQSFTLTGAMACGMAFDALEGHPADPGYHCAPVTLVTRESCGCHGPDARGNACAQFAHAMAEAAYGGSNPTPAQWRQLLAMGERLAVLLTQAAHTPGHDAAIARITEAAADQLAPIVAGARNPMRIVGAVRRFARALAARLDPDDVAIAARLERIAFDLSLRLLGDQRLDPHDHPIVHKNVGIHRRYYMISSNLVRHRAQGPHSLAWLEATEFRAGCFALWEGGRGDRDHTDALRVVDTYDRTGNHPVSAERCAVQAFPPASFLDLIDDQQGDLVYGYLLPVRFDGSDWGFLALTGPLDAYDETAFERYNHWAVLLSVALDHEHAMRSERALLEEIRLSEERYALAAEAANDGLWDWNLTSGEVYYSSRWKSLLGHADDEIAATADEWLDRVHPEDRSAVQRTLAEHAADQSPSRTSSALELEYRLRTANGMYRWMLTRGRSMRDETGRVTRLIGSMTDIADRKYLEDRLRHDAHYDGLTGLPNRVLFLERLNRAIARSGQQPGYAFAVAFLDLNGFKIINDSLGHEAGDRVLVQVAARLADQMDAHDTVARFGGDEFVLLLEDIRDMASLPALVGRIVSALSQPLLLGKRRVSIGASAGIAASPTGRRTAEEFLRDADTAMYRAKMSGNGSPAMFDESMRAGAMTRLQLESDLHQAIIDHQFELHYQPILRLHGRNVIGLEALIRWRHPERGLVLPNAFLPVAEKTDLIQTIGRWVIRTVCRQIRHWLDADLEPHNMTVSINLSNRQFWDPELRSWTHQAVTDFDIPKSMLVFEVTEGVVMHNQEEASALMRQLRDDTVQLHIDDFGTGHSSLAALHAFPIDALKIDRSFVARMRIDPRSRELVRIMIGMGLSLGMDVVAEGVETEEEAAALADLDCPSVQGYLFSPPIPADSVPGLLPPTGRSSDAAV
ncbi:MAG: EAL domain-containing protein [Dactylosporangium sp.]|nr:EAL domain-containing protein [Dactylosporangium sp.]NNJ61002.1 EAL domain-containing protein [Dactylosporangium sp.]